ncbi:hypothetical protein AB0J86_30965 [Micromonospora sp. NPDC049559]|uniref:hypothetical protein n=1 Tax=Micromonospora sp. NPDC049559 TaxID=3155923 RepID=UPI0034316F49
MSERVEQLLEEAVADVAPRIADPAATVVRRGRVARFRAVTASAVAVLAVAGGGVGVAARLSADPVPPPPVAGVLGEPEPPRVVDGKIVAGNATIPVPPGWRVVPDGPPRCGMQEKAVLISGPGQRGCTLAPIEIQSTSAVIPFGRAFALAPPSPSVSGPHPPGSDRTFVRAILAVEAPHMLTLPGGEPGWLVTDTASERGKANYDNTLVLPWSQLSITLRVDGVAQQRFIDSIRTTPRPTTRLALPATAAEAELSLPPLKQADRDYARSTDSATTGAVLRLLNRQTQIVDNRHACASQSQPTARLLLRTATLPPFPTAGTPDASQAAERAAAARSATMITIALGDGCREAVSSRGGRVRLDEAAYRELLALMGIGAR